MVSKARLDLPDPDNPVNTMSASRGRSRWMSRRLCSRAPRTTRRSATWLLFGSGAARAGPGRAADGGEVATDRVAANPNVGDRQLLPERLRATDQPEAGWSHERLQRQRTGRRAGRRATA